MARRSRSRSREKDKDRRSSRRRERSRTRSRSRDRKRDRRDRSRSRERSERRDRRSNFSDAEQTQQYAALQQLQQQQLQKQLLTQQLLLQQQAIAGGGLLSNKKQREVYVGNLTIGVVTDVMLKELFNGALAHLVPDPVTNPPVVNAQLDPSGRFGFVEMRSEELATSAMQLDKVELCGRHINVGRPKGYVEGPNGPAPPVQTPAIHMAQQFAAQMTSAPSAPAALHVLLLENMLKATSLLDEEERRDLLEEVKEEAGKYGTVLGIAVPRPPPTVGPSEPSRVFVKFGRPEEGEKAREVFDGRQFDGNRITARFVSDEDFARAHAGEYHMAPSTGGAPVLPGPPSLPGMGMSPAALPLAAMPALPALPLPSGISGVAALNPAMSTIMQTNPQLASMMATSLNPADVPHQEGWIKLRGIPFTVSKQDIMAFFQGCGDMSEDKIRLVLGMDGRPTGEAYVEISGPTAKLRLALAKDRQVMPNSSRYVEIFTSSREEVERRILTGETML